MIYQSKFYNIFESYLKTFSKTKIQMYTTISYINSIVISMRVSDLWPVLQILKDKSRYMDNRY